MQIRLYPDPLLREPCAPVEVFDQELADFARRMVRTMCENGGLGLAGPQLGATKRLFVVSPDGEAGRETVMVNPQIVWTDGRDEHDEGCLSFPGIYVKISRPARVRVRYQDVRGAARRIEAEGLTARAIQHEMDHLDGRLLVDRMSSVQRMANRRRLRQLRDRYESRGPQVEVGSEAAGEP